MKSWDTFKLIREAGNITSLSNIVQNLRPFVAKVAQKVHQKFVGQSQVGLCTYIVESVIKELKPRLSQYGIGISEYFGSEIFNPLHDNDHVTLAVWNPATREAFEIDIPETKYQSRVGRKFQIIPDVHFSAEDVVIRPLDFSEFDVG